MEENKWESGQAGQSQLPPLQVPEGDGEDWGQAQDAREPQEDIWTPQAPRRRVQPWQVLLAAAAVIFAVRTVGGLVIGGITASRVPAPPAEEVTQVEEPGWVYNNGLAAITDVDVDVALGDVSIQSGDHFGLSMSWETDNYTLRYEQAEDGTLRIWGEGTVGIVPGADATAASVTVTLPEGHELEDVTLHTDLGDIDCWAEGTARDVDLSTDLGDIYWSGSAGARDVTLHSDMGDVTWYCDGAARDVELSSDMGKITARVASVRELTATTNMGDADVDLKEQTDVDYDLSTDMGEVLVNWDTRRSPAQGTLGEGGSRVTLSTAMGDVSLTTLEE